MEYPEYAKNAVSDALKILQQTQQKCRKEADQMKYMLAHVDGAESCDRLYADYIEKYQAMYGAVEKFLHEYEMCTGMLERI